MGGGEGWGVGVGGSWFKETQTTGVVNQHGRRKVCGARDCTLSIPSPAQQWTRCNTMELACAVPGE